MSMRPGLLAQLLVEVIYPKRCAGCGRRNGWVCADCASQTHLLEPPWCARCGTPPARGCRCADLSPALDAVRSAALYDGWIRNGIIAMKFADERARGDSLAPLLRRLQPELAPIDGLIPVPLHSSRLRERGFNQSEILARLASYDRMAVRTDVLLRTRPTPHQVGLGADARRANVHGAFAVRDGVDLSGCRLVLVDDVLTTGATLGNCAAALRAAGAAYVAAITVARE